MDRVTGQNSLTLIPEQEDNEKIIKSASHSLTNNILSKLPDFMGLSAGLSFIRIPVVSASTGLSQLALPAATKSLSQLALPASVNNIPISSSFMNNLLAIQLPLLPVMGAFGILGLMGGTKLLMKKRNASEETHFVPPSTKESFSAQATATAQAVTAKVKNIAASVMDYCASSTEHPLEKDNLVVVEKNNHFMIKNKESNTQSDIHLTDAKDIGGHYKDITFTLDNKDYGCKLYTKKLNIKDLKNIVNQATEHFVKGQSSSDSDTSPHILPETRDDTYPIPTQYDIKDGTKISPKLIKDDDIYSLFTSDNMHHIGDIRLDTTQKNDPFPKNNLGKYHHIRFIHNQEKFPYPNYNILLYKDAIETPDIISALEQALEAKDNIILNKDLKRLKTSRDWKRQYNPHNHAVQLNEIKLLHDKNTTTHTIALTASTDLIEINNKGQKSFLTIHKHNETRPTDILTFTTVEEEKTLIGGKKFILHFRHDGIHYSKKLPPHIKSLQDIDINDPNIKKLFTPDTVPVPPLNMVYELSKDKDGYSISNKDNNTQTPVILSKKQKDIKGDYTTIHFNIDGKDYTKKIYSKNPPQEKDIQRAFDRAIEHLDAYPSTTYHALEDKRDPAYPPVTSQLFEADSRKMQLVKDGDTYSLFSEDGKTCLTKEGFKIQNTIDPFVGYGLGTHHALGFTIEDKPYKIDIYKNTLSDDNILESVKKAINAKSDIILDAQLNPFKKAKYWKDTYPILSKPSVPQQVQRLLDKNTLSRTSDLSSTTSLIELNHKGDKSFLTFQKPPSGEEKFTTVKAWEKEDDTKTKMLSFEIDHQKYDTPLPLQFKSLQEIDVTLPTLKDIFKPTAYISTQELPSTHTVAKQKTPELHSASFTPSFTPSSGAYRKTKSKRSFRTSLRKTKSLASYVSSGISGFFGRMFGGFLGVLGEMAQYAPTMQGGYIHSPQQQNIPNYFMPPPQSHNTIPDDMLMPQPFDMNMLPEQTPWKLPENLSPDINIYKPPYAQHTPPHSSLPHKGGQGFKGGKSGGKFPKTAKPFIKPEKYHPYKKYPYQKEYDPQFYQNFQPAYQQTVKPPYPMSAQDTAYMEQLLDDSNKS